MTGNPREIAEFVRSHKPQLVLLDLVLPGTAGIELMQRVPALEDLPVIFISGYGRDDTISRALELGAVDDVVKPFSPTELTVRVRAALRGRAAAQPFVLGDLAIHYEQRRVSVARRAVQLTATEFELLRVLSVNAGRVLTYDSATASVGRAGFRQCEARARPREESPAEIGRGRGSTLLHSYRARSRLPHATASRYVRTLHAPP